MATVEPELVNLRLVPTHDAELVAALLKTAGYAHVRQGEPAKLRWLCWHPDSPRELLFALLQFPDLRTALGHRQGPRELLEVLAEAYGQDEAILTLGKDCFSNPQISEAEFETFLERHRGHNWLYETLCRTDAGSTEKRCILRQHLDGDAQKDHWHYLLDLPGRIEQIRSTSDEAELRQAYASNDPAILLAVAGNVATPTELLQQLVETREIKHASEIRRAASSNLARRR